ncbi:efflux RND transporter periplasmic adaptor subunit [Pikeienuella sp. HZG-20]|uniref:efflux RND transporter periplasmic adaptor subunit n=1 Tax=Paludibacillus litoralis TaxID=3133267 RepID=UPI0030EB8263
MAIWRQVLILLILAGLGYGGLLGYERYYGAGEATEAGAERARRAASVETAIAEIMTLERTVEAVGTTRARRSVKITPLASGRLVELAIDPGDRVEAGAVLARLDDEIERADLVEAEALAEEQRNAVARARRLRESKAVAAIVLEKAVAGLAVAEAALERAQRRLEDRVIRAPFAGQVGFTDVDLGARVNEGDELTRLDDLTEIEVQFSLPETLFAEIAKGMPISAISAAFPGRTFTGEVAAIDSRIDPVGRSFKVRATIPNPAGELPAGMFMSLSLTLSAEPALVVPEEAIVAQAADTFVFVVADGKAVRRAVKTGLRKEGVIAVTEGLAPGEAVVTRGLQSVRDGAPVRVLATAGQALKS